jgi:hypothetical protein
VDTLTPFEKLYRMEICGVRQKGVPILPELVIRCQFMGEGEAPDMKACIDPDEDDGA